MSPREFCLASGSPRRQEMLAWMEIGFHVQPADLDERPAPGELADEYVWRLAGEKAMAAGACAGDNGLVLAADTTVVVDGMILGKPGSRQDAADMLHVLRGRIHQVYTAIAVYDSRKNILVKDLCCADVPMRNYSDAEIETYVASGDPLDKAGAYGIQHAGFHPVENFSGCFACVMGMPLCHLKRSLRSMGYPLAADPAQICLKNLSYPCSIHQEVLNGTPGK